MITGRIGILILCNFYWALILGGRRIEAAEMKLLRPLAGYTLYDHKTNTSIRKELRIKSILDKIDEYRKKWLLHIKRMPQNRIPLKFYNYRPQGRRSIGRPKNVGESNYSPGDGTDQRVQSLVFMMMTDLFSNGCFIWRLSIIRLQSCIALCIDFPNLSVGSLEC